MITETTTWRATGPDPLARVGNPERTEGVQAS